MPTISEWLQAALGLNPAAQQRLALSVIVVAVLWLVRFVVLRVVLRRHADVRSRYRWQKASTYVAVLLGTLVLARLWLGGLTAAATYFGLLSAGLAIALKDLLIGFVAWLFILWRRPFEVGDRIEIGGVAGDVIDQRIFQFSMLEIGNWVDADQSTGRVIHVPNGEVFAKPLANYTRGFAYIWNEVAVLVTFESDWRAARDILRSIGTARALHFSDDAERQIQNTAKRYMIFFNKLTPNVYVSVKDSGVMVTLRYLTPPRTRRATTEAIWEDILDQFAARNDIDFAYPTQRFYDNVVEGKPGARAALDAPARASTPRDDTVDARLP